MAPKGKKSTNKKVTVKKSSTVLKQQHNPVLDLDSDVTELVSTELVSSYLGGLWGKLCGGVLKWLWTRQGWLWKTTNCCGSDSSGNARGGWDGLPP
jgi:hypothetical protein